MASLFRRKLILQLPALCIEQPQSHTNRISLRHAETAKDIIIVVCFRIIQVTEQAMQMLYPVKYAQLREREQKGKKFK